ncbi:AAA family ATPase [Flavobacterium notoginsengisoli]|uniref:AAA family ATPase n=1 Tax=Flavobacterium notoginsengisoli TaxID=1478199 RepID=UPI003627D38F
MRITLKDKYKSLNPFISDDLSDLTVIIGKNGSGKSQLLNLISNKFQKREEEKNVQIFIIPEPTIIQFEGIIKDNLQSISYDNWKSTLQQSLLQFKRLSKNNLKILKYIIDKKLDKNIFSITRRDLLSNEDEYIKLLKINISEKQKINIDSLPNIDPQREKNFLQDIYNYHILSLFKILNHLSDKLGKPIEEIVELDFYNSPIDDSLIDVNNLFSSQIEYIFYNYAKRRDINRKNWFYKKEDKKENDSISDDDFINNFPPPWNTVNDILEANNLDFYFKEIEKEEFSTDITIDIAIIKKSTGEKIPFIDLSSGEKVIFGLILKLFTSEYYLTNLDFPDLIILDEPDAHLHPEMSYLLINVLQNTFVTKFGIKIILTTHSPSTIALLNEDNIYQISNGENTFLKKISKDDALKLLTSFIPTLSIDYKNHKQVFVESPTDRFYYQTIFDKLSQYKNYPFQLYFISNGYGKGSSSQVKETITAIRNSENKSFFGIIDWDKNNKDSDYEYVKVHGENQRYSIENYVYDPIYLIIQLMELKAYSILSEISLDETYNQYQIGNDTKLIEKSINWFFEKYYLKFPMSNDLKNAKRKVKFFNGIEYEIPIWYLESQGHDLETKLKMVFKPLEKFKNEGELQKSLSIISSKCFPFIHLDTVNVFEKIINFEAESKS